MPDKIKFENVFNNILCTCRNKNHVGLGIATLREGDKDSTLMGETMAYYKAKRNLIKKEIDERKKRIKLLNHLFVTLFPQRLQGRQVEWIKDRLLRFIEDENFILKDLQEELKEWNEETIDYLKRREESLKIIKDYKERKRKKENERLSENTTEESKDL